MLMAVRQERQPYPNNVSQQQMLYMIVSDCRVSISTYHNC